MSDKVYESPLSKIKRHLQENYNLNEEERKAVCCQIFKEGKDITKAILKNQIDQDLQNHIKDLKSALEKLPKANNIVVYRHWDLGEGHIDKLIKFLIGNVGKILSIPYFLATSKLENWDNYPYSNKIRTVNNSRGADIHKIRYEATESHLEEEVLFPIDSKFKILLEDDDIILEEIVTHQYDIVLPNFWNYPH